jgi:hypothetical protein
MVDVHHILLYPSNSEAKMDRHERNDEFEDFLDDTYEPYKIGDLTFYPSQVLRECDPVAYRCYLSDWEDSQESEEEE